MKRLLYSLVFFSLACTVQLHAQLDPTLSIQGILKKSNGVAVDDGIYSVTFKLYTVAVGGTAVWNETQSSVEVSTGIYSVTLGTVNPLNVPFNQPYYLGVTFGSSEMAPRVLLTAAPYALSLIGQSNKFPSAGVVNADSIGVKGGVLADGGTPGLNGVNKNGYAFSGNNGDTDSGLFSTADGKVALYANNVEVLTATPTKVQTNTNLEVTGDVSANSLNLPNTGSVIYDSLNDWRLVELDNFSNNDAEGWQVYNKLSNQSMGWNNPTSSGASDIRVWGGGASNALFPGNNDYVLKKNFNLAGVGPFTQIKVRFRYYFLNSWGWGQGDRAWAAFASDASGTGIRVGWDKIASLLNDGQGDFNTTEFVAATNFQTGNQNWPDHWNNVEMTARAPGSSFWVFIGAAVDDVVGDESFAVGAVEIYVR